MILSIIVPVFNEESSIPLFINEVRSLSEIYDQFSVEIIFINDGSTDKTAEVIREIKPHNDTITLINFSRNFGKEAALFAGLEFSSGDAVIPMDVDLQDPVCIIPEMIKLWQQGADVVLAKRTDRSTDGVIKKLCANSYYFIYNLLTRNKIESNAGDYRLLSRKTVDRIISLPESSLFMKGLMSWVGGKTAVVEYSRPKRKSGHSKFNGWRLWNFALDGITSFSTLPLRIWTYIGLAISMLSLLYGVWIIISNLTWGNNVPGYSSLMVAILFLGGVQLIGIGVMGEYIGRIFMESKHRPKYILEEIQGSNKKLKSDEKQ
ncbi:glycosyltransferase family 2 protein [Candidatus Pantoea multigeneris]|uniref:Glycosyltransferase family 2 protein n=1 Tax=Candidatus Pantoea multigeneris TaxID=2608357 RepID=A0ABX0RAD7_9GAMM|nr:glycosyltransferase family 2 protein [Pantoea multigeneris]NIF22327.1 glycosyltransferase family 2 protein [Pantoea multigeneris]